MTKTKYNIGEQVRFINDYGIDWGIKRIIRIENISYSESGNGYYLEGSDTPWFTPTPWTYTAQENNISIVEQNAGGLEGQTIAKMIGVRGNWAGTYKDNDSAKANAQVIVKAVNNHDALINALIVSDKFLRQFRGLDIMERMHANEIIEVIQHALNNAGEEV